MFFFFNENKNNVLTSGWNYYDIMHKNRLVARIYETGIVKIKYAKFLPFNLYLIEADDINSRINNLSNFYYWCSSRLLTLDRKYAKEILNSIGATQSSTDKDRAAVSIAYHGLSLLDVYWIKSPNEKISFDDISLYRHSLSGAFVDVSLRGKSLTLENSELCNGFEIFPDLGTPGIAPKAWIRRPDTFYLLKDGDERDVKAELLASKIVRCFNVNSVEYIEDQFEGQLVSKSKIITSEEYSIVSTEYVEIYCANHDYNTNDYILRKDRYTFYMMNIIDYLVGNTDRHWGNWGFFIDNNTNSIKKMYPLMDFNKSFRSYSSLDGGICQTYFNKRISQKEAAIIGVERIGLNQISDINEEWFEDEDTKNMFFARLHVLKSI